MGAPEIAVGGIFVGGRARRMGGEAKGWLVGPDGRPLIERARDLLVRVAAEVVLVGEHPAYAGALGLATIADDPPGVGPIGGLAALLVRAGSGRALALACDMPFVAEEDLRRLAAAGRTAAPRRDGRWEPLVAAYDALSVLPIVRAQIASGAFGMQEVLTRAQAVEVPVPSAHLVDWDAPGDVFL